MIVSIKNPAPLGPNLKKWGDYHFGLSLQRALEALGHVVHQHYWPKWEQFDQEEAILVLRGKRRFQPTREIPTAMWVISHPSTVSNEEIEQYDIVFVASAKHQSLLQGQTKTPIEMLRQCTDTTLFYPPGSKHHRRGLIFVADSRGVRRELATLAAEFKVNLGIIGRGWETLGFGAHLLQETIPNPELPELYRQSRLSFNDHWGDMKFFGYINNRVFDCLACGLPILSDDFEELREVCGDALLYAHDRKTFLSAMREFHLGYSDLQKRTQALWEKIGADSTFAVRAKKLSESLQNLPSRTTRVPVVRETPAPTPALAAFRAARRAIKQVPNQPLKVLHLFPDPEATFQIANEPEISYLSGGLGEGPWHTRVEGHPSPLPENYFELTLLQSTFKPGSLGYQSFRRWLSNLRNHVKIPSGVIAVVGQDHLEHAKTLSSNGSEIFERSADHTLVRARPDAGGNLA